MDHELTAPQPTSTPTSDLVEQPLDTSEEITKLRGDFQSRLVVANLRTEAVRAGMVDLDGLKLIDLSDVRLGDDDKIIGARKIMDDLRRNKPWLFAGASSSNVGMAPASQPMRQKTALEMSDEEYSVARAAVTRQKF